MNLSTYYDTVVSRLSCYRKLEEAYKKKDDDAAAVCNDRELVLAAVKYNGRALEWAAQELKEDREIVFEALSNYEKAIDLFASKVFDPKSLEAKLEATDVVESEKERIMSAIQDVYKLHETAGKARRIQHDWLSLQYRTLQNNRHNRPEICDNANIVIAAVQAWESTVGLTIDNCALQWASERLRNDRNVVLAAVQNDALSIRCTSEELKGDHEVVLTAVKSIHLAFQRGYVGELVGELGNDREIIMAALAKNPHAIHYSSSDLRNDQEIMLAAVKADVLTLQYASDELLNNVEFALAAYEIDHRAVGYFSEEVKLHDRHLFLEACGEYGYLLESAPALFRNDREIVHAAVAQHGDSLQYASPELRYDKEIVLAAVAQEGTALLYAPDELKNNKEFVLQAIDESPGAFIHASAELRNDKHVCLAAVKQFGDAFQYVSEQLKNDKEVVLAAVKQFGDALEFVSEQLRNDKEVVLAAVKQCGYALFFASEQLRNDKEVVLVAVKQFGAALEIASEQLRNDKEVVLAAVKQDWHALEHTMDELRNDKEITMVALRHGPWPFRYASDDLKNSIDVVCATLRAPNPDGDGEYHALNTLDLVGDGVKEKIRACAALAKNNTGDCQQQSVAIHLEEKFALRRVFLELMCSSSKAKEKQLCPATFKDVAEFAGVPFGDELRQLRLIAECLPLEAAFEEKIFSMTFVEWAKR